MGYRALLCGVMITGSVASSQARDVEICFALWDAEDGSHISVRGDIIEVGADYLTVGNKDCDLDVFPDNEVVPENCKVGGTVLARGVAFALDYNDLVDATVSCR